VIVNRHSACALPCLVLALVFHLHQLLREDAILEIEVAAVQRNQLRIQHLLRLLYQVL